MCVSVEPSLCNVARDNTIERLNVFQRKTVWDVTVANFAILLLKLTTGC